MRKKITVEEKDLAIIFGNGLRRTFIWKILYFCDFRPLARRDSYVRRKFLMRKKISCEDKLGIDPMARIKS